MKTPQSLLPDLATLTVRLTAALNGDDASGRPVKFSNASFPVS